MALQNHKHILVFEMPIILISHEKILGPRNEENEMSNLTLFRVVFNDNILMSNVSFSKRHQGSSICDKIDDCSFKDYESHQRMLSDSNGLVFDAIDLLKQAYKEIPTKEVYDKIVTLESIL
jgi:hypothetical protein